MTLVHIKTNSSGIIGHVLALRDPAPVGYTTLDIPSTMASSALLGRKFVDVNTVPIIVDSTLPVIKRATFRAVVAKADQYLGTFLSSLSPSEVSHRSKLREEAMLGSGPTITFEAGQRSISEANVVRLVLARASVETQAGILFTEWIADKTAEINAAEETADIPDTTTGLEFWDDVQSALAAVEEHFSTDNDDPLNITFGEVVVTDSFVTINNTVSVKTFGARGDGVTDDTAAIVACVLANPGKRIFFPRGIYVISATILISTANTILFGEGDNDDGTVIDWTNGTIDNCFALNAAKTQITNMKFRGKNKNTQGWGIYVIEADEAIIDSVTVETCYVGMGVVDSKDVTLSNITTKRMLGWGGIYLGGTSAIGTHRCKITNYTADSPRPLTFNNPKTWSGGLAVTLGDVFANNTGLWQCSQSGTTSTQPSAIPGTNTTDCFTTEVTDGTAKWRFIGGSTTWIVQDNYCYDTTINGANLKNGIGSVSTIDNANTGSSYSVGISMTGVKCQNSWSHGIRLYRGQRATISQCEAISIDYGNGFEVYAGHKGAIGISNSVATSCYFQGIYIEAGPVDTNINGCQICNNSRTGSGTAHGITISGSLTKFSITNNKIGALGTGSNLQGYGISFTAASAADFIIQGNNLQGNVTGALNISGSTPSNGYIKDNVGYKLGRDSPATPASAGTYTAGPIPETIFVVGGTITDVKLTDNSGPTVFTTTPCTLHLEPNESFSIIYSVAPTLYRVRH